MFRLPRISLALMSVLLTVPTLPALAFDPSPLQRGGPRLAPDDPNGLPDQALARLGRTRFLQGNWASVLAYSPNGTTLAAVDRLGMILVWDRLTGRELHRWPLPPELQGGFGPPLNHLEFTPDGRLLIAAGKSGVRVHDLAKGELLYKFPADPLRGAAISPSPDGRRLIVRENGYKLGDAGKDGIRRDVPDPRIRVYDLTTGAVDEALTERLARYGNAIYSPNDCAIAAVRYDGKTYADRGIDFLDPRAEKVLGKIDEVGNPIFSPDGSLLLGHVGCPEYVPGGTPPAVNKGRLRAWSVPDGRPLPAQMPLETLLKVHAQGTPLLIDNDRFLTAGNDGAVRLWRLSTGKEEWKVQPGGWVPFAVSPDGKILTTGLVQLRHYEIGTRQDRLEEFTAGGPVALSPKEKYLAYAPADYTAAYRRESAVTVPITLTDLKSGKSLPLEGHTMPVLCLGFTPDDATLVSAGTDGLVRGWVTKSGKALWKFESGLIGGQPWQVSPTGEIAFATGKSIVLFDPETGKQRTILASATTFPGWKTPAMAFSGDGQLLFAVREDRKPIPHHEFSVWNVASGKEVALIDQGRKRPGMRGPAALSLSSDHRYLAAVGVCCVRVRDMTTGVTFRWPCEDNSTTVAFSPDGKTVASGHLGGAVRLWDLTGTLLQTFEGHRGPVAYLSWSADGKALASSGADGSVLVWDVTGKAPARPKPAPLTDKQRRAALDKAWDDLAGKSAQAGYRAMLDLGADPKAGVALLKDRLKPDAHPGALRASRAVELLEYLGTPGAVAVLRDFVKAAQDGPEKAEASAALRRLDKSKPAAKE